MSSAPIIILLLIALSLTQLLPRTEETLPVKRAEPLEIE